jgi:drug/metabolite transporter (DMT)-like permease
MRTPGQAPGRPGGALCLSASEGMGLSGARLAKARHAMERAGVFTGSLSLLVSEALAVASAFCIALSSMLLSELKGRVPLLQLARWQQLAGFAMTGAVSLALGGWRTVGAWQFGMLAASSLSGIVIASTTYFAAIYSVGPRVTALLFSLTSPFALALGYLALGETISRGQAAGVALVLAGVALAIGLPRRVATPASSLSPAAAPETSPLTPAPPSAVSLWPGVALGLVTAFGQAVGSLLARPAMASGVEPFTAMALRSGLAALVFVGLAALPLGRAGRAPLRADTFGIAVASAFFGTALGMSLLMAALRGGQVGIVSTLSSVTPVLILPMLWVRTRERPPLLAWIGALLAVSGTALISLR